jgi:hypothetical protein
MSDRLSPLAASLQPAALTVRAEATGVAFWEAAVAAFPKVRDVASELASSASASAAAPPAPRTLCQALALLPQEHALNSLLFTLRETSGAGRPTALTQELAGMRGREPTAAVRAICLRLGLSLPSNAKRTVLEAAITSAVQQHAEQHPERAQAALKGTAVFDPPRLFFASLPPAVASQPASAVQSQTEGEEESRSEDSEEEEQVPARRSSSRATKGQGGGVLPPPGSAAGSAVTRLAPHALQALQQVPLASAAGSRRPARSRQSQSRTLSLPAAVAQERSLEQQFSRQVSLAASDYESAAEESDYEAPARVARPREHLAARSSRARAASPAAATLEEQLVSAGVGSSLAPQLLANILRGREQASVEQVLASRTYQSQRNNKEVLALARVVDCLRRGHSEAALELTLRRISGVLLGDKSEKWSMCDFLMHDTAATAYLPHAVLQQALAYSSHSASLTGGSNSSSSSTRRSHTGSRSSGDRRASHGHAQRSRSPSASRGKRKQKGGHKDAPAADSDKAPSSKSGGGARH